MEKDATVIVFDAEDECDGVEMCKDGVCEIDWGDDSENECTNNQRV